MCYFIILPSENTQKGGLHELIPIPDFIFAIVVIEISLATYYYEAAIFPNDECYGQLRDPYFCSIDEINSLTGLNFLHNVKGKLIRRSEEFNLESGLRTHLQEKDISPLMTKIKNK